MVSTKTFDNIKDKKDISLDDVFKSILDDLKKTTEEMKDKLILQNAEDIRFIKRNFYIFFFTQMVINILLCVGILLK